MTSQRFFVHPDWIQRGRVTFSEAVAHQIRNVLRLRPGDRITVLDNSGWEYDVELEKVEQGEAIGRIRHKKLAGGEPRTKITLYQGVLKGRNLEWVLQKGTELGIAQFVPVICDRCILSSLDDISPAKITRWQRIILEAAEQAGRGRLPQLRPPTLFSQACTQSKEAELSILLWEGERTTSFRHLLENNAEITGQRRPFSISLHVGPEGGYTEEEVALAKRYGMHTLSLGPRILRAETAGLVAAAILFYALGDLE